MKNKQVTKWKADNTTYYNYKDYTFYYSRSWRCWLVVIGCYEKHFEIKQRKKFVQDYEHAIKYIDSITD